MTVFLDRSADPVDEATELAAALPLRGIAQASAACAPEHHEDFDGLHCVDCDEEIPAARLALRRVRCVECQTIIERVRSQRM